VQVPNTASTVLRGPQQEPLGHTTYRNDPIYGWKARNGGTVRCAANPSNGFREILPGRIPRDRLRRDDIPQMLNHRYSRARPSAGALRPQSPSSSDCAPQGREEVRNKRRSPDDGFNNLKRHPRQSWAKICCADSHAVRSKDRGPKVKLKHDSSRTDHPSKNSYNRSTTETATQRTFMRGFTICTRWQA
jgi:hypothetical protein